MKFLVHATMDVEAGNAAFLDGSIVTKIQKCLNDVKPEAVYFGIANGQRSIYLIVNVDSMDKLPEIAEPLWLDFKANIEVTPLMTPADLEKAGASFQRMAQARR